MTVSIELVVNGAARALAVEDDELLGDALRDRLGMLSVRYGCHEGVCGSCTVLVDGEQARACLLLAAQVDGSAVATVEGLAGRDGLDVIQQAFVDAGAIQCGFCTSGFLMATVALLDEHPELSRDQIAAGLAGNLCRCTGYAKIVDAVAAAALARAALAR